MNNKKSQMAANLGTIVRWAVIIAVGIVLLVILAKTTGLGGTTLGKIIEIFPFV